MSQKRIITNYLKGITLLTEERFVTLLIDVYFDTENIDEDLGELATFWNEKKSLIDTHPGVDIKDKKCCEIITEFLRDLKDRRTDPEEIKIASWGKLVNLLL
jgi:hypothetical protein